VLGVLPIRQDAELTSLCERRIFYNTEIERWARYTRPNSKSKLELNLKKVEFE